MTANATEIDTATATIPKIGDVVYVPTVKGYTEDSPLSGGKATILAIDSLCILSYPHVLVRTSRHPGIWYIWKLLEMEQSDLKIKYGM